MPSHSVSRALAAAAFMADKKCAWTARAFLVWFMDLAGAAASLKTPVKVRYTPQRRPCGQRLISMCVSVMHSGSSEVKREAPFEVFLGDTRFYFVVGEVIRALGASGLIPPIVEETS